ncbi:MAG: aldehyde dehydrogenase family protein [Actinomycetota bacterium]
MRRPELTVTDVQAPADGARLGQVELTEPSRVPAVVAAARAALADWSSAPPHARAALLERGAAAIEAQAEELARLHARESGKVIAQARKEVAGAASLLRENARIGRYEAGYLAPTGALPAGRGT